MIRIPFLRKHNTYREMADAYLDGELRPGDLAKFEAHSATCEECGAMVAAGRVLKQAVTAIPEVAAPRSFRITPAMLAERTPAPKPMKASPVLMVARFGAAASVAAFGVVGTLQFSSTSGNDGRIAATSPQYELASGAAEDSSKQGDVYDTPGSDDNGEILPLATQDPQIAPPPSADVGGAGVTDATPEPSDNSSGSTTGGESPDPEGQRSSADGTLEPFGSAGDGTVAITALPADSDDASYAAWLIVLGGVSVVALGTVGTMEFRRRQA